MWGAAAVVVLAVPTALLAVLVFQRSAVVVPMVGPGLSAMFAFLGATSYVSIVEGKEKRMIKGAFGKYVSPVIVDQLVADPKRLKLGGERRLISVLFSDMTGFTAMSETMEPERLVQILNEYLDEMSDVIINSGGTLDKYIGDAIMAFYGAPAAMDDHAAACCRTALEMQRMLAEMNERYRTEHPGWPVLQMRIGINSGMPVVGNIGGKKRFDYTALGDTVNLSARLEPACKIYGVRIMIGQATREYAGDNIQVRELDMLAVYGKKEPIRVYELLGWKGDDLGDKAEVIRYYNRGLSAFRDRDFELALQYFRAALEVDPTDGPSALYVERCEEYMVSPPPADWDFVERRQAK
jgi:adenylate cyclase